jgi:hypothetical protein
MAQKPYKHNIEYIQKYYSYGSEAKVIEFKPLRQKSQKPAVPKREKEPVTTVCIDPIAFCGMMVAVVMVVVLLAGILQFSAVSQDHEIMENYVMQLREEKILQQHQYKAGYDLDEIEVTARALGMIPIGEAETISLRVEVPARQEDPGFFENVIWFFSGLFA